jgi:hypothetical protein
MNGKLYLWLKRAHLFLGVFFSPLLLMFIITGWWQTVTSDDDKERDGGRLHELMKQLSNVHTDDKWPRAGVHHAEHMKYLVVAMSVSLILTILLGLFMAWKTLKSKWLVALAFVLGILIPAVVLYIA